MTQNLKIRAYLNAKFYGAYYEKISNPKGLTFGI